MRRRFLQLASGLSLLLCVAAGGMWVRSYWAFEGIAWHRHGGEVGIGYNEGRIQVAVTNIGRVPAGLDVWSNDVIPWRLVGLPSLAGFSHRTTRGARSGISEPTVTPSGLVLRPVEVTRSVTAPAGLLALVAAGLFVAGVRGLRVAKVGVCAACGYDLRATPERCPECGVVPVARPAIAA